jgi:hypothetical protein
MGGVGFFTPCGSLKIIDFKLFFCASVSLSYDKKDFVSELQKLSTLKKLKGIGKGICIDGIGYPTFSMTDLTGKLPTVKMKAVYWVPRAQ